MLILFLCVISFPSFDQGVGFIVSETTVQGISRRVLQLTKGQHKLSTEGFKV